MDGILHWLSFVSIQGIVHRGTSRTIHSEDIESEFSVNLRICTDGEEITALAGPARGRYCRRTKILTCIGILLSMTCRSLSLLLCGSSRG